MAAYCRVYGVIHCGLTACTPWPAPGPMLCNEYGRTSPLSFYRIVIQTSEISNKYSNTNWKHFEQLKWTSLTSSVLCIHETRNTVSTKQLRKNYHQQHRPTQQHIFTMNTSDISMAHTLQHKRLQILSFLHIYAVVAICTKHVYIHCVHTWWISNRKPLMQTYMVVLRAHTQ